MLPLVRDCNPHPVRWHGRSWLCCWAGPIDEIGAAGLYDLVAFKYSVARCSKKSAPSTPLRISTSQGSGCGRDSRSRSPRNNRTRNTGGSRSWVGRQSALVTLLAHETEVLPAVGHVRKADQQALGRGFDLIEPGAGARRVRQQLDRFSASTGSLHATRGGCLHVDVIEPHRWPTLWDRTSRTKSHGRRSTIAPS
jgi:hypothetical protein